MNLVYHLSILSNIPNGIAGLESDGARPRLQSLFAIGVHDIALLEGLAREMKMHTSTSSSADVYSGIASQGWVACTTDSVLAIKRSLYDVVVHLPPRGGSAIRKNWPRIESSAGTEIRATQRDLRRYTTLRNRLSGLRDLKYTGSKHFLQIVSDETGQHENAASHNACESTSDHSSSINEAVVEPPSWSEMAYSSFMWWASAGEQQADLDSETSADDALLDGLDFVDTWTSAEHDDVQPRLVDACTKVSVLPIIVYFRRLTCMMLSTVAELVDLTSTEDEESATRLKDKEGALGLSKADISHLGLDIWSAGDVAFVKDLVLQHFGREVEMQSTSIECCGVRVL